MINKTIQWLRRRREFVSVEDTFFMARIQEGKYNPNTNKVNVVIGSLLVVYGGVTILLPTGSIAAIMLGMFLIACPISIRALFHGLWSDVKFYVGINI